MLGFDLKEQANVQTIFIPQTISKSTKVVIQEIFRTLGRGHEHRRPDRDTYVNILWKNINEGHQQGIVLIEALYMAMTTFVLYFLALIRAGYAY